MQVAPGTRLGPYEILAPLGAGGMGEVWSAKDTRLQRNVAVKILPPALAENAQLRARFEREARAISQLSHPNICTIHDVGHDSGTDFLVMELLEGESLAQRLMRGPLGLTEVFRYGVQIAEALDRAHRSGIVHRDLKPANIMLTKSGAKLLDFGLAKASTVSNPPLEGPTIQKTLTQEGTIVGTYQYMAPEQLAGDEADARTDIFAFGAVLYEMVSGKRAFDGKTKTSLIGAIVGGEPQRVSEIQPLTPPALEHVIARCLAKEPDDRWQSAHDIAEELRWISGAGSHAGIAAPLAMRRKTREKIFAAASVLLLIAAAALGWAFWREKSKPVRVQRASIVAPAGTEFVLGERDSSALTISPDGRWVTFAARNVDGPWLWLHSLETGETRQLGRGHSPFWSPDSKLIGVAAGQKIRRLDVSGGPAVAITDGGNGRGATWNREGTIVFEPDWREPLYRVSVDGEGRALLTTLDASQQETTHRWPWFLPDGRHFLYLAGAHKTGVNSDVNAIYIGSLDSPERKLLLRARSNAVYADGHVLFVRDQFLMAQPFDPEKLELTGDPVRLAENVTVVPGFFRALFGVSNDGTLVYFTGPATGKRTLKWLGWDGKEIGTIAELDFQNQDQGRISPDGKLAVVAAGDPWDLWIVDLERGTPSRFTSAPMEEFSPVWSPDGTRIAYASNRSKENDEILVKSVDGLSRERVLFERAATDLAPTDWSRDGRFILADVGDRKAGRSGVWLIPAEGTEKPVPLLESDFDIWSAQFSGDGRWVTFLSDETGQPEIYAVPYPVRTAKRQLTSGNVRGYGWTGDRRRIAYAQEDGTTMAIDLEGNSFGVPRPLGRFDFSRVTPLDVSSDGRVLAVHEEPVEASPITIVTNWTRLLR